MPSANGHSPKKVILYARVSTEEQAKSGYSLAQQLEALRGHASCEGYEILEEVIDRGQSGASLERPGMDRVRDLVAAGGVSVVLAQDRDRFAREPAYHYILRREFEEYGCKLRALNDRSDDSPEGELTDGILDQLAKFERAKMAERTRRGKLRKAREGKLIRNSRAHYGFEYDDTGEGYVVKEEEMRVVRRIFRAVAGGSSLHGVKRSLELDGVPPPGNRTKEKGRYWSVSYLRKLVEDDVYKPHSRAEVEGLVDEGLLSPEVAGGLNETLCYGVFWFNRTRVTRKRVSEASPGGREYRWQKMTRKNPRDQWIGIPVPDAGVPLGAVEDAREMVRYNRRPAKMGRRFWEIPGGAVRCAGCGNCMFKYASMAGGHVYAYYKCARLVRNGKDACSPERRRTNHRAEKLEQRVWGLVSGLMKDPEQLRADLERMIELEQEGTRGDPERDARMWLEKLSEIDRMRRGYQEQAAKGLMTLDELGAALGDLDESRRTAEQELEAIKGRQARIKQLERDKDALLQQYSDMAPEALDALSAEERHHVYRMLQLDVLVHQDETLEVSGAFAGNPLFSNSEWVPTSQRYLGKRIILQGGRTHPFGGCGSTTPVRKFVSVLRAAREGEAKVKKPILLTAMLVIALATAAPVVLAQTETASGVQGSITDISWAVVLVEENPADEWGSAKGAFTVTEETEILRQQGDELLPATFEELWVGQQVTATYVGPVAESYPSQGTAGSIIILEGPLRDEAGDELLCLLPEGCDPEDDIKQ